MRLLLHHLLPLLSLSTLAATQANSSDTYDYIVVGSGPGGGPLAANLAKAGYSVLLIEAGEDRGSDLNQVVPAFGTQATNDENKRWDFFVKYHSDEAITNRYTRLTWRKPNGEFYVGTNPPANSTKLGVYYPRTGTLGGCSTHNAMASALGSNRDWEVIANLTGDQSWLPENMRKYFIRIENNHYLPKNTPGHGFDGFLDLRLNEKDILGNQSHSVIMLQAAAKLLGQDPNKIFELVQRDLNNNNPNKDQETGIFGFPAHYDMSGKRVTARNPILQVLDARNPDGSSKYKLKLQLTSLATRVLFGNSSIGKPQAIGVEYLKGKALYSADPRSSEANKGVLSRAYATKEVIISGGTFNSPQLLKLSGIGPKEELARFKIPLVVDLPGVGTNLQDNYEIGAIAHASTDFISSGPTCAPGQPDDPCLALWRQGKGPYVKGPLETIMLKSSVARYGERDLFVFGDSFAFRGFWPGRGTPAGGPADPPTTFGFSTVKMHPSGRLGTVMLRSADPRDVPDINFRFFEDPEGDQDIQAMSEGIEFGRKVFDSVGAPIGPFVETDPCAGNRTCDVKDWIRTQAWSHHATSSCSIGADSDKMAVLDSRFRVRGVNGLRVVDASAFPRIPGAFPVVPTFILSEKASDVILEDARPKSTRKN